MKIDPNKAVINLGILISNLIFIYLIFGFIGFLLFETDTTASMSYIDIFLYFILGAYTIILAGGIIYFFLAIPMWIILKILFYLKNSGSIYGENREEIKIICSNKLFERYFIILSCIFIIIVIYLYDSIL